MELVTTTAQRAADNMITSINALKGAIKMAFADGVPASSDFPAATGDQIKVTLGPDKVAKIEKFLTDFE